MTAKDLRLYLDKLSSELPLDRYMERRFASVSETGGVPIDVDVGFSGMLRDREPKLDDILKHARVLILAEPGGGKSVVARAAVHEFLRAQERVPIFVELKAYRGDLAALLAKAAPPALLGLAACIDGKVLSRAYVFDGIDEIPSGLLTQLGTDLQKLFESDSEASVLLTERQAFYAAHRDSMPAITALFCILDFSDRDIAEYLTKSNVDKDNFLAAVRGAGASEEIRNPFILFIMVERYREAGVLSDRRSDTLSYMIDRLIQSRPHINGRQQRRALRMLGLALETYSRNELTEDEALRVIKQAMRITDADALALLDELYGSILKRTGNGLAFQSRSYGEYLAAETLEDEPMGRIKELAFLDYDIPNETWLNTVSYLVELNPDVRRYFARRHPLWTIPASPAAFSAEEKIGIVTSALEICHNERQLILHHPLVDVRRLARFVTGALEKDLFANLADQEDIVRGNAFVLLGHLGRADVVPAALSMVKDRSKGDEIRWCAIVALANAGSPRLVPELLAELDRGDRLHMNFLDMIGALIDESQIQTVLPLILRENAMLSSTYYHFRELKSRAALIETLRYFLENPSELNIIRAEGYVEPILELLATFFDAEIAELCAHLLEIFETLGIYPDRSGPLPKLFELMRKADHDGNITRIFFERVLKEGSALRHRILYIDQVLGSLMTPQTAQWLIDRGANELIRELAPYSKGEIREMFRPHSQGLIDKQDESAKEYRLKESEQEESRTRHIKTLQARLLSRISLNDVLECFCELKEDYWPELPGPYKDWLALEISKEMTALDLETNVRWKETTLWQPQILPFFLRLIDRYALRIEPDEPLIFAVTGWDAKVIANYYKRFALSARAVGNLERILENPTSPEALQEVVRFVESSGIWSPGVEASLKDIASHPVNIGYVQVTALAMLIKHGVDVGFIEQASRTGANEELRNYAFEALVEQQHRPTIERSLTRLSDDALTAGNVGIPHRSPLDWLVKIKCDFAWGRLETLRARALKLELAMLVGLVTEALARINRTKTATLIRRQIELAPQGWRTAQMRHAIEQERTAKIEAAQRTLFDDVLKRLKPSTSVNRLKVLCEGKTDRPVFKSLLGQLVDSSEVIFDLVGGWSNLCAESDPQIWLLGCKEAMIVMDGDNGRHLKRRGKPYTELAKKEEKKLSGLPIELRVLERHGLENYFPQHVLEKVVGTNLSGYFPIPDSISVIKHLSKETKKWKYGLKKLIAGMFDLPEPSYGESLYSKSRNVESAQLLCLSDLNGTDLFNIIHEIAKKANQLAED